MLIANCPKCFDSVRAPDQLPDESKMRCPLCKEEYELGEILRQLPPQLEVLETPKLEPVSPVAGSSSVLDSHVGRQSSLAGLDGGDLSGEQAMGWSPAEEGGSVATLEQSDVRLVDAEEPTLSEPVDTSEAPAAFSVDTATDEAPTDAKTTAPAKRRKKKQKLSPRAAAIRMTLKVVGGGVAGLGIATVLIWYLPIFPDRDPLGFGEFLSKKLPAVAALIVPAEVRGVPRSQDTSDQTQGRDDGDDIDFGEPNEGGEGNGGDGFFNPGVIDEDNPFQLPEAGSGNGQGGGRGRDRGGRGRGGDDDDGPLDVGDEFDLDPEPLDPGGGGSSDPFDPGPELPGGFGNELGVIDAPSYTPSELGIAFGAALEAKQAWDAATDATQRTAARELYASLCEVAEKITFVDMSDGRAQSRLDSVMGLLMDLGDNQREYSLVAAAGGSWIALEQRSSDGVLIAGTVESIERQGQLYETRVKLATRAAPVYSVMSQVNPLEPGEGQPAAYDEGSRVLILGMIVDYPELKLGGYEGAEPLVVWGGYPVEIRDE